MANMFKCVLSSGSGTGYELQVTCSDDFASNNITASDGTTTLTEVCPAASPYVVNFSIPNSGTWTISGTIDGITYTNSIEISLSGNLLLETGLSYITWLTEGGLDPSDYANLNAVLADEEAVRRLMTVHDSVDYLATCSNFNDSLLMAVINSNVCAKWINLRDYALDTLYANTYIKTMMDTADKYFYGEWVITDDTTTPATWGPKGNVPVMTSNTAPYGTASAYQVFDEDASTSASGTNFSYQFTNPTCVKKFTSSVSGGTLQGSNDGSTYTTIETPSDNSSYYLYYRVHYSSSVTVETIQFYGRSLNVSVPAMTSNTAPYGEVSASGNAANHEPYRAFNGTLNSTGWCPSSINSDGQYIQYRFVNPVKVNKILAYRYDSQGRTVDISGYRYTLLGSNDDSTWETITDDAVRMESYNVLGYGEISNSSYYSYYRIVLDKGTSSINYHGGDGFKFQFYGVDYSEREFAEGSTMKYLYDHGVELETIITSGTVTLGSDCLTLGAASSSAYVSIDTTDYDALVGYVGAHGSGTNRLICGSSYSAFSSSNMPYGNGIDISAVTGTNNTGVEQTSAGTCDITEMYVM